MANQRDLKAFVRYDGSGRVVAGSLVLRKKKPKVGRWEEILTYECCNPTTTTTTTSGGTTSTTSSTSTSTSTSTSSTTTTTAPVGVPFSSSVGPEGSGNFTLPCTGTPITLYTNGANPDQVGTVIYLNAALTQPFFPTYNFFLVNGHVNAVGNDGLGGNSVVISVNEYTCPI